MHSHWRAFGIIGDLDLDFSDADRPALVTRVLSACSEQAYETGGFWSLTLAERIGALLRIVSLTEAKDALTVRLRCPRCSESLEVVLPYAALLAEAQRGAEMRSVEVSLDCVGSVELRRPTGEDQRNWRARAYARTDEAVGAIVASLAPSAFALEMQLGAAHLQAMSEAMETFDPLAAFQVATCCPGCGAESSLPVDLEAVLLARLEQRQRRLLEQVHTLAALYGWTEEQVLAVPAWRREQYLGMIERGAAQ